MINVIITDSKYRDHLYYILFIIIFFSLILMKITFRCLKSIIKYIIQLQYIIYIQKNIYIQLYYMRSDFYSSWNFK